MPITRDQLYEAAFKYKKAGIWKKLWDNHVFAVNLPGGEIGYVSIMGRNGEYNALGLYIGGAGFRSYRMIANESPTVSLFQNHERMISQNCLHAAFDSRDDLLPEEQREVRAFAKKNGIRLNGKNAYPHFLKFRPNYFPWRVEEEEDMEALYIALRVSTLLAENLKKKSPASLGILRIDPDTKEVPVFEAEGDELIRKGVAPIPDEAEEEYEYVPAENEIVLLAVKKLPSRGVWEAEYVCMMEPVQNNPEETPYYPFMLLLVKSKEHYVVPVTAVDHSEENPQGVLQEFANALRKEKVRPKEIRCRDERTFALLKDFCGKAGIRICVYDGELPSLDDAEASLMEETLDIDADEMMDAIEQFIDLVLESSEEELRLIPEEMMQGLWMMIDAGMLDEDVAEELRRKLGRI